MPAPRKTVIARVSGRVQGVSFRAWTQREAMARGLTGWVRNEPDGTVTALLSGPASRVDEMTALLRQGPRAARVESVDTAPAEPVEEDASFTIRR